MSVKILFCGDVVGRSGRESLEVFLPDMIKTYSPDIVIVNGENACHGFGITPEICKDFYKLGAHVISTGNHIWDQKSIIPYIAQDPYLIRPLNYPDSCPGKGYVVVKTSKGENILVINVMGNLFMPTLNDAFESVDRVLKSYSLGASVQAIIIDIHAEATSEKMALAHFYDGKVSAVLGTHTHIPTADDHILPKGTAYQTDIGMCGDYHSIIGMDLEAPLFRFVRKMPFSERMKPAQGEGTLCATLVEINEKTGKALSINAIRLGGILKEKK